ncbi:molybdenum cofactor guanylyltransferase MobA [Glaciimonas soli]|uniref:Molybdenum cofactor guanylyltransferase n=1 Tax=Glaciimonas soli TaxID=2590999 RepID=A0A843YYW3_9BURK|nr:molybdenum cofactor guanylyltransferase MobA [Glaciimonas soli]MQR01716.1 molybdenum cofactor guanylyltransferase MobA [Glaciimonas soli]
MQTDQTIASNTDCITGLIIAGGRGNRMGGVDKGLQLLNGVAMISHVIARLSPQVATVIINANRNLFDYAAFGVPVYPDQNDDFAGPLAGIQAGLRHCSTPFLVTAPCDSPFLPNDLVQRLFTALETNEADLAVAVTIATTDTEKPTQAQPVFMLLKTSLSNGLDCYLQEGGRKIENWYRRQRFVEVPFDDTAAFQNINTMEELLSVSAPAANSN